MTTEIDTTATKESKTGKAQTSARRERKPRGPSRVDKAAVDRAMETLADEIGDGAAVEVLGDHRLLVYGPGGAVKTDEPIKGRARQVAFLEGALFGLRIRRNGRTV